MFCSLYNYLITQPPVQWVPGLSWG